DERRAELTRESQILAESLRRHTTRSNQWLTEVEGAFSFCRSLKQRFEEGTSQQKRAILEIVGSNRCIRGKKLFIQPDELFATVRSGNENGDWRPLLDHVRKISQGQTQSFGRFQAALNL
uniref:hypothetical protein n=1 Tax=Armatimonas sp. TaxID=1872638 RepID=UPI00286AD4C4